MKIRELIDASYRARTLETGDPFNANIDRVLGQAQTLVGQTSQVNHRWRVFMEMMAEVERAIENEEAPGVELATLAYDDLIKAIGQAENTADKIAIELGYLRHDLALGRIDEHSAHP